MPIKLKKWLLVISLMGLGTAALAAEKVQLLTYYTLPPFAVDSVPAADSYTVQLAHWLSQWSGGRFEFVPRQVPRLRLDYMLANPEWRGVVAWANPTWFSAPEQPDFLWSRVLMRDHNLRVSRRADKVLFAQGHPLKAARFGGISGHRYEYLEAYFRSGLLQREDAQNELSNVLKLQHKRVDLILLQASSLPYLRAQLPDFDRWAYVDEQPQFEFERFLFTSHNNPDLLLFLNQALPHLARDPGWTQALQPLAR
ncbi:MAG: hypothetical protein Q8R10_18290 [Pseudomonas sp.]|uniref:hypothetical protein n=1 Tax=Pseudomonas sp. TaxID=306 RepID=UPI002734991B|nr:hypothetical protein [Pseudomonas sp.]MDP3848371.1 hypothetical protein [Pseudomonas sp.]